jgi:hypothetical protein
VIHDAACRIAQLAVASRCSRCGQPKAFACFLLPLQAHAITAQMARGTVKIVEAALDEGRISTGADCGNADNWRQAAEALCPPSMHYVDVLDTKNGI